MTIELPSIQHYPNYDFSKLIKAVETNIMKLRNGSERKPSSFNEDIAFFKKHWLKEENPLSLNSHQLRSVTIHLVESKESFRELLDTELLPNLLEQLEKESSVNIQKRIVQLFFTNYFLLQEYKIDFRPYIKRMLHNHHSNNYMMNIYKNNLDELFDPSSLKEKYGSVEEVWSVLNILPHTDYYKFLLVLDLMEKLQSINPGDGKQTSVFENIKTYKDFHYNDQLLIKEYAVRVLISKMMQYKNENYDYTEWINFIINIVGDPRIVTSATAQNVSWDRIGNEYKDFLVGYLSKEDLVLFLEVLSDPEYDNIYRFRKAFWKPFVKHLRYAKLFINKHEFERLDSSFQLRFIGHKNTAYSFISDTQRSFIYMDFGTIKVIEGTHNAKVRLYNDTPIPLDKKSYDYQDFYRTNKARQLIIDEVTHSHSEMGSWQNKVFNILRNRIPYIDITLSDTLQW